MFGGKSDVNWAVVFAFHVSSLLKMKRSKIHNF